MFSIIQAFYNQISSDIKNITINFLTKVKTRKVSQIFFVVEIYLIVKKFSENKEYFIKNGTITIHGKYNYKRIFKAQNKSQFFV